ncbi:MAG TPA: YchJ family metal-binding protein [Myxococcales bacterium]|nr:YchJ family metal-binding protein [Myxococcales bacterium]
MAVDPGACPCGSGQRYRACCRPFHDGAEPPDPVALMRSRFSAFAVGEAGYVWRTLHPEHPDRARGERDFVSSVRKARQAMRYVRLRVLDHGESEVLFHAEIYERGKERSFVELSRFERDPQAGGAWRYRSGQLRAMRAGDPALEGMTLRSFPSG